MATQSPYKKDVFSAYLVWVSIPEEIRALTPAERVNLGLEELVDTVASLRTKSAFAEFFEIDRNTLTDWDKTEEYQKMIVKNKKKLATFCASLAQRAIDIGSAPKIRVRHRIEKPTSPEVLQLREYFLNIQRKMK